MRQADFALQNKIGKIIVPVLVPVSPCASPRFRFFRVSFVF